MKSQMEPARLLHLVDMHRRKANSSEFQKRFIKISIFLAKLGFSFLETLSITSISGFLVLNLGIKKDEPQFSRAKRRRPMRIPKMISLKLLSPMQSSLWAAVRTGLSVSKRAQSRSHAPSGNALMEYVVPAVVLLISAGVLMTLVDTTGLMAQFYLSASGRTSSSLAGTSLQTKGLGENAYGDVGNGLSGFTSFGKQAPKAGTGGTLLYIGQVTRTGGRGTPADPEYLFPNTGK